ncbi:MAG TPA: hypothetical protein VEQ58_11780, partial [Polyangiaceae bacterium]|nr:hypothetical protein [Polyangiaceae bacterium]
MKLVSTCVVSGLLAGLGCMPAYLPPTADQPHAIFKLRRSYETTAGTHLQEFVHIDEHVALEDGVASDVARTARADAILVHPVPTTVVFGSSFTHLETKLVQES